MTKETEQKIIHTALHGFGVNNQRIKCIEELSELIKELCKDAVGSGGVFHISEEIADVEIMLAQMKVYYNCESTVELFKDRKLEQLAYKINIPL